MAQAMDTATRGRKNGHARAALQSRATDVIDDISALRKDIKRLADAANLAARAEVKQAGQKLGQAGKNLRTRAGDGANYAVDKVREHPGAAIGLSLGAGLLLGMLLTRR
jgi:ElaB/YqjD/DUF883 family membrane-anchored ribosome-binding protein